MDALNEGIISPFPHDPLNAGQTCVSASPPACSASSTRRVLTAVQVWLWL